MRGNLTCWGLHVPDSSFHPSGCRHAPPFLRRTAQCAQQKMEIRTRDQKKGPATLDSHGIGNACLRACFSDRAAADQS